MTATGLVCALVAGTALAYAVEEGRRLGSGRLESLVGRGQAVRRIVGSVLVAGLMVLVHLGLDVVDPVASPRGWLRLWAVASALVVLLFALAILDLRELRRRRDIERVRHLVDLGEEVKRRPRGGGPGGGGPA